MSRNLVGKYGFTPEDTAELELRLTEYLPWALVEVKRAHRRATAHTSVDPKDRHVLATAVAAHATILVTDNDRHFPEDWMARHGIELLRTGGLVARVATENPEALRWAHRTTVANSPRDEQAILGTLESAVGPTVAALVRSVVLVDSRRTALPLAELRAACADLPPADYAQLRREADEFFGDDGDRVVDPPLRS